MPQDLRRALIVGIDHYQYSNKLTGCIKDAKDMAKVLSTHGDPNKGPNFETIVRTTENNNIITQQSLMRDIEDLFESQVDRALFYFSGHGYLNNYGGYLVTPDASEYNLGVPMTHLMKCANQSKIKDKFIILDCCHSGKLGRDPLIEDESSAIKEGIPILTACHENELADKGVFTSRLLDALNGEAADILGRVTLGNIYALIDESLGAVGQRPIFKANVRRFISLRDCKPAIKYPTLREAMSYFSDADAEYPLDPEHEPTYEGCVKEKTEKFANLQECRAVRLVEPANPETKHMYDAAMKSENCRLTSLGKHYWKGIKLGKI